MATAPAVLQVLPALVTGGVERGTIEIAEAIRDAGMRAIVASAGGPMVAELEALGVRHVNLPLRSKSPVSILRNAASLAALVREEGVRLVHARSRAPAWSALLAARRSGAAFVTTYHGVYNEGFPGKRFYNAVMARGDRVIAVSDYVAAVVRERHGLGDDRLRVIPRGVDARRFDPDLVAPERVLSLRAAWGGEGRQVILLPGRLTRWKGQSVLIQAMAALRGDALAVLAGGGGEGAYRGELVALARQHGVADRVLILGHVEAMATALLAADVVVHASTDAEAFGRTVIEAQAMGRPIIASDLGGPRETVRHGVTGWRVPPGDPQALAATLDRVLSLPALERAAVARAGRDAVLRDYTTARMQEATLGVYRELLR